MDLASLIPLLRSQGVARFEGYGIKVEFHAQIAPVYPPVAPQIPTAAMDLPLEQAGKDQMPVGSPIDLRGDDLMNYDKVLHWSGAADPADPTEMPLTGEQALAAGAEHG